MNSERPVRIPTQVLDAAGNQLSAIGVRYEWLSGASLPLSTTGLATCPQSGDAHVRASLDTLETTFLLRCRPVRTLYMSAGPLQFVEHDPVPGVLTDSAQALPIVALGPDGRMVHLFIAKVIVHDDQVVTATGLGVRPRSPGATVVTVQIGDRSTMVSTKVYERIRNLDDLGPQQNHVAIPMRLSIGEMRRWPLAPGRWMLTMLPREDSLRGLRLRIERANCAKEAKLARRYTCFAGESASVIVYHPGTPGLAEHLTGELLVQRLDRAPAPSPSRGRASSPDPHDEPSR